MIVALLGKYYGWNKRDNKSDKKEVIVKVNM